MRRSWEVSQGSSPFAKTLDFCDNNDLFAAVSLLSVFSFKTPAAIFWAIGILGIHGGGHTRDHREGSPWGSGLRETCLDSLHRLCCSFCPNPYHHGEQSAYYWFRVLFVCLSFSRWVCMYIDIVLLL